MSNNKNDGMILKYHDFDLKSLKKLVNELIIDCDRLAGRVNVTYFIKNNKLEVTVKYQNPIGELFKYSSWHYITNDYNHGNEYITKELPFELNDLTKYNVLFFVRDVVNEYNQKLTDIINNRWFLQFKLKVRVDDKIEYLYWNCTSSISHRKDEIWDYLNNTYNGESYSIDINIVNTSYTNELEYRIYYDMTYNNKKHDGKESISRVLNLRHDLEFKQINKPAYIEVD